MLKLLTTALIVAATGFIITNASFCGKTGVPYSFEVLPSGAPVLGCAQPSCVVAPEEVEVGRTLVEDSEFLTDVNGQADGFFREGDRNAKHYRHRDAPALVANCSGGFNELSCSRKNQWVGGIEYIDHPRQPFPGLRFSQEVGSTVVGPGEAITGGEVIRSGRQISFDVIANVRKIVRPSNATGSSSSKVSYEVTVRRMNCLPDPPEPEVQFDEDLPSEVFKVLSSASNKDLGTSQKFEKKPSQKYDRKVKPKQEGAPIEQLSEVSDNTGVQQQRGNNEASISPQQSQQPQQPQQSQQSQQFQQSQQQQQQQQYQQPQQPYQQQQYQQQQPQQQVSGDSASTLFPTLPTHTFSAFASFPTLPPHTFPTFAPHTFPTHTFPPFPTFSPIVTPAPAVVGSAQGANGASGPFPVNGLGAASAQGVPQSFVAPSPVAPFSGSSSYGLGAPVSASGFSGSPALAFAAPSVSASSGNSALAPLPTIPSFFAPTPAPFSPLPLFGGQSTGNNGVGAGGFVGQVPQQPAVSSVPGTPDQPALPSLIQPPSAPSIDAQLRGGNDASAIVPPEGSRSPQVVFPQPSGSGQIQPLSGLPPPPSISGFGAGLPAPSATHGPPVMGSVLEALGNNARPISLPGLGIIGYSNAPQKK